MGREKEGGEDEKERRERERERERSWADLAGKAKELKGNTENQTGRLKMAAKHDCSFTYKRTEESAGYNPEHYNQLLYSAQGQSFHLF